MTYTSLQVTHEAGVAELTLVSKRGALGPVFWQELPAALSEIKEARAVLLRSGEDFSVGLDLVQTAPLLSASRERPEGFFELLSPCRRPSKRSRTFRCRW